MTDACYHKAQRVISAMCAASYHQANTKRDGTRYRRHRPYRVPAMAEALVQCLNRDDEEGAKALFLLLAAGMPADAIT